MVSKTCEVSTGCDFIYIHNSLTISRCLSSYRCGWNPRKFYNRKRAKQAIPRSLICVYYVYHGNFIDEIMIEYQIRFWDRDRYIW